MTNTYKVPVTFLFTGYVEVKADDAKQAKEIANSDFGCTVDNFHTSNDEHVVNWDFSNHPDSRKYGHVSKV